MKSPQESKRVPKSLEESQRVPKSSNQPTMHVEIKVAQNFALNFLFNKLPRRRVNLFGEELESALSEKFADHWYPDKPFKGSAFR